MNEERIERKARERRFPANGKGFLVPPVLWFVWFLALYSVQGAGCELGWQQLGLLGTSALRVLLLLMTIVTAAIIVTVGVQSFRAWCRLSEYGDDAGGSVVDQAQFLAYGALLNAGLFLVAVIWTGTSLLTGALCNPSGF